jgi:hypothetical protein
MRAANVLPRQEAQLSSGEQHRPLRQHVARIGGKAIGSVVNEHKDFKTIDLRYIEHVRSPWVDSKRDDVRRTLGRDDNRSLDAPAMRFNVPHPPICGASALFPRVAFGHAIGAKRR